MLLLLPPPTSTLFPYTTLFRSNTDEGFSGPVITSQAPTLDWWLLAPFLVVFGAGVLAVLFEAFVPAARRRGLQTAVAFLARSEEHTSELQSRGHLVCRLLLEKK